MTKAILFEVLILLLETLIVWIYKKINDKGTKQQTEFKFA